MPSPTSRTLPTSRESSWERYWPISSVSTETISSALNLMAASRNELVLDRFQARLHRQVEQPVADLDLQAADQVRVHRLDQHRLHLEVVMRPGSDLIPLLVGQRHGGAHLHTHAPAKLVAQLAVHR